MASVNFEVRTITSNYPSSEVNPYLKLKPVYELRASGSCIIIDDPENVELDDNASATVTGLIPNVYTVEVWTEKKLTAFNLLVPSNVTSSTLSAADWIVNDFTGSSNNAFKLVPVPANTASFGQAGWIAVSTDFIYIYSAGDSLWKRTPLALY